MVNRSDRSFSITRSQYDQILKVIKKACEEYFDGHYIESPNFEFIRSNDFSINLAPNYESIFIKIEFKGTDLQEWLAKDIIKEMIIDKIKNSADKCKQEYDLKFVKGRKEDDQA